MLLPADRMNALAAFLLIPLVVFSVATAAYAEVPSWVKSNAGWWAEGAISEGEFLAAISHLISTGVIIIEDTSGAAPSEAAEHDGAVPEWVKSNAGWWAEGAISDDDFLSGIQYLIRAGLIVVPAMADDDADAVTAASGAGDPVLAELEAELEECSQFAKAYQRIDCEKPVKQAILVHDYRTNADVFAVGPINYYWFGLDSEGNGFEISPSGQALLSIRMLAENTDAEIASLDCTSPSLCSYDVWDGSTGFRYAGTDFTSGQIVLNPGDAREFNMLFGPNVGYGGSQFLYDPSKTYHFRINESFGSAMIPLGIAE